MSGEVRHAEEDPHEHEARAEVGLAVDERERRSEQHERAAEDQRRAHPIVAVREVLREHDDHQDLRELADLELLARDRDPALPAEHVVPDEEHEHEQPERDQIEERREGAEPRVVEVRDGGHDEDAENGEDRATEDELHRIARGGILVRRRVRDHEPVGHEQQRRDEQVGIDEIEPAVGRLVVQRRGRAWKCEAVDAHLISSAFFAGSPSTYCS